MDSLFQDIRYAARKLLRSPGFTMVAVATLALGIGATTAVFSIVNGVLLKPLPYRDPATLVMVSSLSRDGKPFPMSTPDFIDYRKEAKSFTAMAVYGSQNMNFTGTGVAASRLSVGTVGAPFFDILGIPAELGRTFAPGESDAGAPRTIVLADRVWRGRFASDPRIIGQAISLDGEKFTVIGVAPPEATFPRRAEAWIARREDAEFTDQRSRGAHSLFAIARVAPGVTLERANSELGAIAKRLESEYPNSNTGFSAGAEPLQQRIIGNVRPALYTMLGAVAFVLLIACANVANLLLVRAATRESEIAVRTALGAGRARLVRQLVTESVMLAVAGAVIGTAIAAWVVDAVVANAASQLPRADQIVIDGRVLLFTAGVAVLTGVIFGLVPAFHAARPDIGQMLRESVRGSSRGGAQRTRGVLVVTELALAVVLLVGSGLLIKSFARLMNVDPGFRTEHVMTFNVTLPNAKYPLERQARQFVAEVSERLRSMPGTQQSAVTFGRPLDNYMMRTSVELSDRAPSTPQHRLISEVHPASSSFFGTLGLQLVRGRLYTADEDRLEAPGTVVVSEEFVRRYFPNSDPLGTRVTFGISHDTAEAGRGQATVAGEIVGVVRDIKQQGLAGENYPMAYIPFNQLPIPDMSFLVRTTADPRLVEATIKSRVKEVDADIPIYDLTTMEKAVSDSVAQPRFYMVLLSAFAGVALLLAALGIYGVISYAVSLRTRELGIRIALGASRRRVVNLVLGQGLWLTLGGVAAGLAAAFWLTRMIASMLFGVGALDPLTFAGVSLLLIGVALVASYIPARRAARVDPVIAMRAD